jgi:hypothetical protein
MSRALTDLCPSVRPAAEALLLWSVERRHFLVIVDTLRTPEEQAEYLERGNSWTHRSKHLAQVHCQVCGHLYGSVAGVGLSHAIDVAPLAEYHEHGRNKINWSAANPVWREIAERAELYGLDWGGHWRRPDLGHLESPLPFIGRDS